MEDISDRRIKQIQESILQEMEELESTIEKLRAQVHPDRDPNTQVVPRPVDPSRHIGFGPTTREIDDFIQGEVLRARDKRS
jgi:hypothetical protein